jgi:excisionase family DNA binding protein
MNRDLLTITEFCDVIGVGRTTAYALLKSGKLKALKIGRRTFIEKAAVEAWLSSLSAYKPLSALVCERSQRGA